MAQEIQVPHVKRDASSSQAEQEDATPAIVALQVEWSQILELSEMEKDYALEIASLLKKIIEPLNISLRVSPQTISKTDASLSEVYVTPQGTMCFISDKGSALARPIENLPPETLVRTLLEIIPKICLTLSEKRKKLSSRVASLEKLSKEFKSLA